MSPRTILITGGSGKLGRSLVSYFLGRGDRVITTCRTVESLNTLAMAYAHYDDRLVVLRTDLTEARAAYELRGLLDTQGIKPDCLVNNARSTNFLNVEEDGFISRENFASEYLLDVIVPYELTMALVAQDNGQLCKVVNIGSQYGTVAANPNLYDDPAKQSALHYGVAKAALAHLTRELAVRLAGRGVRVNCVAFGGVEGRVDEAFKQRYARLCPMGRMLREEEVVSPVDMLLSEGCSGITGHVLAVDGGWGIW